ncbi:class I SAM-dependent methyltransferase [Aquisphaera insulae]|uniref:class I SAM-dependent methyltransferase n=1 Tax=Aquisphaera insulae TaxID=2712864 RepID=UPI0013ECA529|nr:class I SAM-dependent methyltransferase [Aquisphaera insulae]
MASPADENIALYQRHAKEWDQGRGRDLREKTWLDRFLGLLPPNASVLDIGCGGGEPIDRYFIEAGHGVTGIDSSPALIGICRERFPDHAWVVSDMRTLALDREFDGLLAWDSFFHLGPEDQRGMFEVFRSHAAPKAALMFTSGPAHGESIGMFMGEPLYHGSLGEADYRLLLNRSGFDVISHVIEDPACGHRTVWLARSS